MKTRPKKELLNLLLKSLKSGDNPVYYNNGICGELEDMCFISDLINYDEMCILLNIIKNSKPTENNEFKSFYHSEFFFPKEPWWWERMRVDKVGREQRILFVEAIIKSLK